MTSNILSARSLANSRVAPLVAALGAGVLLAGCARRDALEEAAWQSSRVGTAVGDHHEITKITGLEAGSHIAERYYYVAKYEATQAQRQVAQATARNAQAHREGGAPRTGAGARHPSPARPARFIAVRTQQDARAKTSTSVMIWDTESHEIVGNNVYDLNTPPPKGTIFRLETFSAEYIGAGN